MTTEHSTHQAALTEDVDQQQPDRGTEPPTESSTSTATKAGNGAEPRADQAERAEANGSGAGSAPQSETLIEPDRAAAFQARWNELKGEFVDDPRHTVRRIDGLVGEVLDELEQVFRRQRGDLESGMADEGASTEDLRVAFGRYREFFDRLISF